MSVLSKKQFSYCSKMTLGLRVVFAIGIAVVGAAPHLCTGNGLVSGRKLSASKHGG